MLTLASPYPPGDDVWSKNIVFFAVNSPLAPSFFLQKPSISYSPSETLLAARWDAARFMNCLIKPIRSSNVFS